jgi:hypothetical protein
MIDQIGVLAANGFAQLQGCPVDRLTCFAEGSE